MNSANERVNEVHDIVPEMDKYGNPIDGDRLIYCCFPDCGCDGARLCMAENGANDASLAMNRERTTQPRPK